jgi:outer membrane protein TolC
VADLDKQEQLKLARGAAVQRATQAEELKQGGRIDSLSLLAAEQDCWTAEQAVAIGDSTLNRDQINTFLALGDGW